MVRAEIKERSARLRQTPVVQRIKNMREALIAAGDEAQELRHLPQWAADEMANAGLYRFALPPELGGENLTPVEQIKVIEAASAIDGSVGWCVQINSEINSLVTRSLDPKVADELYDDWGIVICCAAAPGRKELSSSKRSRPCSNWSASSCAAVCVSAMSRSSAPRVVAWVS